MSLENPLLKWIIHMAIGNQPLSTGLLECPLDVSSDIPKGEQFKNE